MPCSHCNLLHRLSGYSRWSLISVYNRITNKPYKDESASCCTPINAVADDALLKAGKKGIVAEADSLSKVKNAKFKEEVY